MSLIPRSPSGAGPSNGLPGLQAGTPPPEDRARDDAPPAGLSSALGGHILRISCMEADAHGLQQQVARLPEMLSSELAAQLSARIPELLAGLQLAA